MTTTPTTPDLVFEGTTQEYFELLAGCLSEAGFVVSVSASGDGLAAPGISADQRDDLLAASKTCRDSLGSLPVADMTDPLVVAEFYEALLQTRDCLTERGYEIAEPPSYDLFEETIMTDPWHPYVSLPNDIGPGEWEMIQQLCPQP